MRTRDRTVWPTGPEISTAWPSTENVCPPLLWEGVVAAGWVPGEKQLDSGAVGREVRLAGSQR